MKKYPWATKGAGEMQVSDLNLRNYSAQPEIKRQTNLLTDKTDYNLQIVQQADQD